MNKNIIATLALMMAVTASTNTENLSSATPTASISHMRAKSRNLPAFDPGAIPLAPTIPNIYTSYVIGDAPITIALPSTATDLLTGNTVTLTDWDFSYHCGPETYITCATDGKTFTIFTNDNT